VASSIVDWHLESMTPLHYEDPTDRTSAGSDIPMIQIWSLHQIYPSCSFLSIVGVCFGKSNSLNMLP
jgi:hypothetical protein